MTSKNSNHQKMSEKGTRSLFSNAFPVRIWSKPNYALVFGFNKWSSSYLQDISLSHETKGRMSCHYPFVAVSGLSGYRHVLANYNCVLKHKCQKQNATTVARVGNLERHHLPNETAVVLNFLRRADDYRLITIWYWVMDASTIIRIRSSTHFTSRTFLPLFHWQLPSAFKKC